MAASQELERIFRAMTSESPHHHPSSPANSLVHWVPDPITNRYRFKLGKAQVEKTGESSFKNSFEEMSFKPRTVTGQ